MSGTLLKEGLWFWNIRKVQIDENGVLRYMKPNETEARHEIDLKDAQTMVNF